MEIQFTPKNLIENLPHLGPWSSYGLASSAIQHYFPEIYDEEGYCDVEKEVEKLKELGFIWWHDVVEKYHKEIGYTLEELSNKNYVNEY